MEFFPMDVEVPAGHTIKLTLRSTGEDYLPSAASTLVTVVDAGSTLQLTHLTQKLENTMKQ